jgi:hypothetical protein
MLIVHSGIQNQPGAYQAVFGRLDFDPPTEDRKFADRHPFFESSYHPIAFKSSEKTRGMTEL